MFAVPNGVYLDFAGGTGVMARKIQALHPDIPATIIVLDPNIASIEAGTEKTTNNGVRKVVFINGYAEDLAGHIEEESLDGIVIANAIHELPEDQRVQILRTLNRFLKPGKKAIANSTFMEESMRGLERRWGIWKATIKAELEAVREVKTAQKTNETAAFVTYPVSHYISQLEESGFEIEGEPLEVDVHVELPLLEAISTYGAFIKGMCGDLTVLESRVDKIISDIAERNRRALLLEGEGRLIRAESEASIRAARKMAGEYKSGHPEPDAPPFSIPRRWIEITAIKPFAQAA